MPHLKVPMLFWGDTELLGKFSRAVAPLEISNSGDTPFYCADNMLLIYRHGGFRRDEKFARAVERHATRPDDLMRAWRTHIVCGMVRSCMGLDGDLVEIGVADGCTAAVILDYVDGAADRPLWLYDAFDLPGAATATTDKPTLEYEAIQKKFAAYPNARIVRGVLPGALAERGPAAIAFLHLDLGVAATEAAALDILLPKVEPGGIVLANCYGLTGGYAEIKAALDAVASRHGLFFTELPTGQGLLVNR